jgi:membrane protein implicated in regulation of membrane protease activity
MTTTTRAPAVAALLGLVTLFVVGFGVTAVLDPYVWPSLLVGIPVGVVAGVVATVASYWLLTRSQRSEAAQQDD